MLLTHANLFTPVDLKRRRLHEGPAGPPCATGCWSWPQAGERTVGNQLGSRTRSAARRGLRGQPRWPRSWWTRSGYLMLANDRARTLFGLTADDLGRPFQDLELSYRPVELRSLIEQVYAERRPSQVDVVRVADAGGEVAHLDVQVVPLTRRPTARCSARASPSPTSPATAGYKQELEHGQPGAGDRLRGAPVDQRGAGDHQRGAPVDGRGAGDHQRGAPVDQRRARDDERGAAVHQRGAADHQRRAARAHRRAQPGSTPSWSRSGPGSAAPSSSSTPTCRCWCGTTAPRTCGGSARRRSRASTSSTWTSACPSTSSCRPYGRP